MQSANVLVDLGGDTGNQVPLFKVSPAEVAVLIAIHGESAVHDIDPLPASDTIEIDGVNVRWTNRVELDRVRRKYGRAKNGEDVAHVDILFPGAAARVFETFDELGLPEEFFKPTARAQADNPLDHDHDGKAGGAAPPEGVTGLEALTVAKLKDLAEKSGIDLGDATKKADIIAKIEAAAPADEDDDEAVADMPDAAIVPPPATGENLFK